MNFRVVFMKSIVTVSLSLLVSCVSVDNLIYKQEYDKAVEYCQGLKNEKREQCFNKIISSFLLKKDYESAAIYYQKAGISDKQAEYASNNGRVD